jgi:hypothetical protein
LLEGEKNMSAKVQCVEWDCALLGSTVPVNANAAECIYIKATAANVILQLSDMMPGEEVEVVFEQDAVGGRTISFAGGGFVSPVFPGAGTVTPAVGANQLSVYRFRQYAATSGRILCSKQIA